jgi:xanthine dehydrogenase accessory factor
MRLALALLTSDDLPPDGRDIPGRLLALQGGSGRGFALWPGGPVFREPAPDRQAIVYGAGHVGRALVAALAPLPFRVVWADARAGACADAPAGVDVHETPLPEAVAEAAEPGALHVVLTHSHALDLEIVAAVTAREFGFCGLIGSATKRALFRRKLAERGVARGAIARLTCPIGLLGLRDKRPAVIASSVAAQLLQVDAALAARRPTVRAG